MSLTYNIYTSNSLEGAYTKIKEGITSLSTTIESTNSDLGEIKYVRVSATNEYGEGFLSQAIKTIFIGKPTIEIISSFKNGYIVSYINGNYATQKTLMKSMDKSLWINLKTDTSAYTLGTVEDISTPISLRVVSFNDNEMSTSKSYSSIYNIDYKPKEYIFIMDGLKKTTYRTKDLVTWEQFNQPDGLVALINGCYIGNNTLISCNQFYRDIYKSSDNGVTWSLFSNSIPTSILTDWVIIDKAIIGTTINLSPVYISFDLGLSFKLLNWESVEIKGMPTYFNGYILCIDFNGRVLKSSDQGKSFTPVSNLPNGGRHAFSYLGNNIIIDIFTLSGRSIIYRSVDGGITWQNIQEIKMANSGVTIIKDGVIIVGCFVDSNTLGVYRSEDNGKTWMFSTIGITPNLRELSITYIEKGVVVINWWTSSNPKTGGSFVSRDNAITWQVINSIPIGFRLF